MVNFATSGIDPEEILAFLKKELSLKEVTQKILERKVIERAAAERNITVTPEEIQAEADRFRFQNRLEKASDTMGWISNQMISVEDWEQGIRDRRLAQKLAAELFSPQVEKYFAENRLDFDQALLYQIIVPYEPVARELFYQIEEEEISFFEAAHLYDINEQRRLNCGYQGWVSRAALKAEMAALVFGVKLEEIVGPIKTEQGYHLLLVEQMKVAELTLEVRQQIIDRLFKEWLRSEVTYYLHHQINHQENLSVFQP